MQPAVADVHVLAASGHDDLCAGEGLAVGLHQRSPWAGASLEPEVVRLLALIASEHARRGGQVPLRLDTNHVARVGVGQLQAVAPIAPTARVAAVPVRRPSLLPLDALDHAERVNRLARLRVDHRARHAQCPVHHDHVQLVAGHEGFAPDRHEALLVEIIVHGIERRSMPLEPAFGVRLRPPAYGPVSAPPVRGHAGVRHCAALVVHHLPSHGAARGQPELDRGHVGFGHDVPERRGVPASVDGQDHGARFRMGQPELPFRARLRTLAPRAVARPAHVDLRARHPPALLVHHLAHHRDAAPEHDLSVHGPKLGRWECRGACVHPEGRVVRVGERERHIAEILGDHTTPPPPSGIRAHDVPRDVDRLLPHLRVAVR